MALWLCATRMRVFSRCGGNWEESPPEAGSQGGPFPGAFPQVALSTLVPRAARRHRRCWSGVEAPHLHLYGDVTDRERGDRGGSGNGSSAACARCAPAGRRVGRSGGGGGLSGHRVCSSRPTASWASPAADRQQLPGRARRLRQKPGLRSSEGGARGGQGREGWGHRARPTAQILFG